MDKPDRRWPSTVSEKSAPSDWSSENGFLEGLPISLKTLLVVVLGVVVLGGLWAWLGVAAWIVLCATGGAFVGLLLGQIMELDTQIDDIRYDVAKCLVAAVLLVGPCWAMIVSGLVRSGGLAAGGLIFVVVTHMFILRLIWRDFETVETIVVEGAMLVSIAFGATVARAVVAVVAG
ncbi:MAG: hypothetical protein JW888_14870 [Pirellulales bacterium]|nr:hypothetical protein [Pirellulales bacterium]